MRFLSPLQTQTMRLQRHHWAQLLLHCLQSLLYWLSCSAAVCASATSECSTCCIACTCDPIRPWNVVVHHLSLSSHKHRLMSDEFYFKLPSFWASMSIFAVCYLQNSWLGVCSCTQTYVQFIIAFIIALVWAATNMTLCTYVLCMYPINHACSYIWMGRSYTCFNSSIHLHTFLLRLSLSGYISHVYAVYFLALSTHAIYHGCTMTLKN